MSQTEDFPPNRDFLGLLLPRPAEHKARRGGNCRPDNFFQVPCNFFYLPDCFSQVLISLAKAAGGLFPKVKYVKVEAFGTPIFRGERAGGQPGGGGGAPGCRREVPARRTKEDRGEDERGRGGSKRAGEGGERERGGREKAGGEDEKGPRGGRKRSAGRTKDTAERTKESAGAAKTTAEAAKEQGSSGNWAHRSAGSVNLSLKKPI